MMAETVSRRVASPKYLIGAFFLLAGCGGSAGGAGTGGAGGTGGASSTGTIGAATSGTTATGTSSSATGSGGAAATAAASGTTSGAGGVPSTGGSSGTTGGSTTGSGGSGPSGSCGSQSFTLNSNPFGCEFAWGTNGDRGDRSSYLHFITTWVGYEYGQGRENDCDGCGLAGELRSSGAMATYYAYFIGYSPLPDCNTHPEPPNLCTDGAQWVRDNRDYVVSLYGGYARRTYQASPDKPVVWLLEGDFVQYTYDEQNNALSMQELGDLARDITCAIKSNMPNAVVAMNHSPWLSNEVTDAFWGAMPLDVLDLVWTTGLGNNDGFIPENTDGESYNGRTARYGYLNQLTGKQIVVDTSFGASQADDSWTGIGATTLNQRIGDGVIAANVTQPPGDYQSRVDGLTGQLSSVCQ
jgi:hypothetical protein